MGKLPPIQNSETRKEKNDEFIFIKIKKLLYGQKKKGGISIVKDKSKKMFPTIGKKKIMKDFEMDDNKY